MGGDKATSQLEDYAASHKPGVSSASDISAAFTVRPVMHVCSEVKHMLEMRTLAVLL